MIIITTFLIVLTALYIYEREVIGNIENTRFNFEPFNCVFCISFWLGLFLSLVSFDLIYLCLPLVYRITQTKLLK